MRRTRDGESEEREVKSEAMSERRCSVSSCVVGDDLDFFEFACLAAYQYNIHRQESKERRTLLPINAENNVFNPSNSTNFSQSGIPARPPSA